MIKPNLSKIPENSGVYIYRDIDGTPIYIGKAKNLRSRLSSYFDSTIEIKTKAMLSVAQTLDYIEVSSDFESELLEASMVRKYMPKFNIELKDDKSPLYVGVTKELYPRIVYLRKTQINTDELTDLYGPFKSSLTLRRIMKKIRRVFPYSDHKLSKKACIYSQIGLCNPCPSFVSQTTDIDIKKKLRRRYLWNISKIKKIMSGEIRKLIDDLDREMKDFSKSENFELANEIKKDIELLNSFMIPRNHPHEYVENPNLLIDIREKELKELSKILEPFYPNLKIKRIECFDIAHISGNQTTASMVTFINGEADKTFYRHFKIKSPIKSDDYAAMREVIERRMNRLDDFGVPDLIIIDGGKGQISSVSEYLDGKIAYIGLAKRFETLVIPTSIGFREIRLPRGNALYLLQRIRDEAHRFARRYHHKLVAKSLLGADTKSK